MTARLQLPFNNEPVATVFKYNAGYTVPANKYARITATLSSSANILNGTGQIGAAVSGIAVTVDSDQTAISFWLKAGDIITVSLTQDSGAIALDLSPTTTIIAFDGSESFSTMSVNGTEVCKSSSVANISVAVNNGISMSPAQSWIGKASVSFIAEEYNSIS